MRWQVAADFAMNALESWQDGTTQAASIRIGAEHLDIVSFLLNAGQTAFPWAWKSYVIESLPCFPRGPAKQNRRKKVRASQHATW